LNIGGWITGAAGAITVPGSLTTAGFTSTGIDDNATSTAITIDASENVAIAGDVTADSLKLGGATASSKLAVRTYTAGETLLSLFDSTYNQNFNIRVDSSLKDISFYGGSSTTAFKFISGSSGERMRIDSAGNVGIGTNAPLVSLHVSGTDAIRIPSGTTAERPSGTIGYYRFNTTTNTSEIFNGTGWLAIGANDGSSSAAAANNANDLLDLGINTSGVYWINLPGSGPTQVYCEMTIDGGGWMMLGYAGSTSGVGDANHMIFNQFGTVATTRVYGQTSFSRFDVARGMSGAGRSSWFMWKRTSDDNILVHTADEMWDRMPGGSQAGYRGFNSPDPITTMKMSNNGGTVLDIKAATLGGGTRYESGPGYPGIAWNSPNNQNTDSGQSYNVSLNRRQLAYWETNGPQSQGQWFHGGVLNMGDSNTSPTMSQSRKDVEIYFRVRTP